MLQVRTGPPRRLLSALQEKFVTRFTSRAFRQNVWFTRRVRLLAGPVERARPGRPSESPRDR